MKSQKTRKYILGSLALVSVFAIVAGTCAGVCYKHTTKDNLDKQITNSTNSSSQNKNNNTKDSNTGSKSTKPNSSNPNKQKTQPSQNPEPITKPNSAKNNQDIVNELSSLIKNPISLARGYALTAQESLANSAANNQTLINAIKTAITTNISSSTLTVDNQTYKTTNIISNLDVSLPNSVSLQDNNSGIISNVTLSYQGINIQNSKSIYYEITNLAIPTSVNSNQNQQNQEVATYLSSLLNGIINIANYSNITAADSLSTSSNQSELIAAIKHAIYLEISNLNNTFVIDNISYTAPDILNNLSVTLPSSVSLVNDENGIMQNVNLKYQSITLTNALKTSNFTVKGFETTTFQKIGNEPVSNNNSNKEKSYTTRNQQIRNALSTLLSQVITLSGFENIGAQEALTNTAELTQGIITALQQEITNANYVFTFNNVTYSIASIINELTINLPTQVSSTSNSKAIIPNVTIEYDQVNLMNKADSIDFIIEGFYKPETINPDSAGMIQAVANKLSSLIKNPITLADGYALTAQESLANSTNNQTLINAIKAAITADISSSTLIVDGYTFQTANIVSTIGVQLPAYMCVSLANNNAGILTDVTLAYKGIPIYSSSNNINYEITNLAIPNSANTNQVQQNQAIANYLSSLLNNVISVSGYSKITAADSLSTPSNQSNLKQAIKTSINSSLISLYGNVLLFNNISYTAQQLLKGLSITLPSSVSLINDENGNMQNVNLQYESITLTNTSHTSNFIVTGFENTNSQAIGSTQVPNPNPNKTNPYTTRNQEIINALNSLLSQIIIVSNYSTITASDALQTPSSLQQAIINAIQQELADEGYDFTFNNVTYSIANILNALTVNLPTQVSSPSNSNAIIPNVTIEYNQVQLSNKASSNDFIVEGFKTPTSSSNPNPNKEPTPTPTPTPNTANPLSFDLDINNNQVSSYPTTLYYLTNTFSLSNIVINNTPISSNSTGTLTYTIKNSTTSSLIVTKTITLSSNSASNWSQFIYDFTKLVTTSSQSYSIEVVLSINVPNTKETLTSNATYNFNIVNPLQLSTSYNQNGSLENTFINDISSWVGQSKDINATWYDFINQWYFWYSLNDVNASYFGNIKVYFSKMPANDNFGSNEFLTIQATSTKPISIKVYTNVTNITPLTNGNGTVDSNITPIPAGSIFTWTLPYELAQLSFSNGMLNLPMLNTNLWLNAQTRQNYGNRPTPSIPEPFGLSIGTSQDPTAISDDAQFNNISDINCAPMPTQNGILGFLGVSQAYLTKQYGNNPPYQPYSTSYYSPAEFSYPCPTTTKESFNNTNNTQTLNITSPQLINFKNTANLYGQPISSSTYSGTYSYSIVNDSANIDVKNNGSLSGDDTLFNYYFDKPGKYEITITYTLNNTFTNTQTYYVNYQPNLSTESPDSTSPKPTPTNSKQPLKTSTGANGSLEQAFINDTYTWAGQSNSTTWYDFINQWYFWYALNDVSASYFDNVKVYFSEMPANDNFGTNQFLTIQATSTKPISVKWYGGGSSNATNPLSSDYGSIDNNITPIAIGSIFTWTLPYELAQLSVKNGKLTLPMLNISLWFNSTMRQGSVKNGRNCTSIAVPFGLSIGTLSDPTAISNDAQFNNLPGTIAVAPMPTQNGVLGFLGISQAYLTSYYGSNLPYPAYITSYYAPASFSYSYSSNTATYTYLYAIVNKNIKMN